MTVPRTISLGFLAVIAVGTLLLMIPFSSSSGDWTNPIVALFTSTSAVCVTGLSVVDVGTYFSFFGQVILVALVQIGGLGYMTATTFLLVLIGVKFGLRDKVAIQQALDRTGLSNSADLIRSIIGVTLIFEITGIFLLLPVFTPQYGLDRALWLAIFHSVNSWNNAGFSLFKDSFIGFQSSILLNLVVTGLIIFGGIGYGVLFQIYIYLRDRLQRKSERVVFSLDLKVAISTSLILLIAGTVAFFLIESRNPNTFGNLSWQNKILAAWFQSVTPRTAGFNTIDIGKMTNAGLFLTIAFMFIGASPGGTGGGIKTTTLRVLTSCTKAILQGKEDVLLYERQIPLNLILKAVGVLVGSIATVILATILISLTDPNIDFIQILFEVVSAFATVGLSTGITANVSAAAKLVLIATMFIGRVGILLLIGAVLGDPRPTAIHYPEENLLVG
ncbi:MAG: Ktr system potassium uptake protein B [Chroococcidiopsis cubana SAG 39.79]|jgi:trk system potassium uptake protein|uniref:Potassium uptake protein, TrkH family n=3 Tax=Chroococcidiopsis TaxID=54298 RepID=K9TTI7_CHRTP|nr:MULTISPECIES: TrkH family potassium uptake protein [Chroococcidiopsis]MBE9020310.1 ATPase [Chroococcidiopsidales cyanobacterium LEGE 13417]PSB45842.1 ATPase [Cyanosarcina cf. burmensis CCALA 770]AFY85860.1 potassium uptake protein, TrkH family [Chroococcidiopsis thermalis PCC 7203]MDZ4873060.1 Ktr system potassium uptake protein B [Chroococcidiopsis cubana SAG 39.79]PSM49466.1 ATPase [Chroococcidiopsis sp. CCALA 051]